MLCNVLQINIFCLQFTKMYFKCGWKNVLWLIFNCCYKNIATIHGSYEQNSKIWVILYITYVSYRFEFFKFLFKLIKFLIRKCNFNLIFMLELFQTCCLAAHRLTKVMQQMMIYTIYRYRWKLRRYKITF